MKDTDRGREVPYLTGLIYTEGATMTVEAAKKLRVGDRVRWDGPDPAEREDGTVYSAGDVGVAIRWDGGGSGTFWFDESTININHINLTGATRLP